MSLTVGPSPRPVPLAAATPEARTDAAALEQVANQLQSVFAEQLFKAMRETVPQGEGAFDGGSGEEMFSGLMDQHLAAETPTQWARGLTDSIARHLRGALEAQQKGSPDAKGVDGAIPVRPLHAPAALDPLHPQSQLAPLQQTPQLQPLQDATR